MSESVLHVKGHCRNSRATCGEEAKIYRIHNIKFQKQAVLQRDILLVNILPALMTKHASYEQQHGRL